MIQALIFDFDGLILDTELSSYQSWQEIYQEHNCYLPLEEWALCIGSGIEQFDPCAYLEKQLGRPVVREELTEKRRQRHWELLKSQLALPGVETYIVDAQRLGVKLAIASSSPREWVVDHLTNLGLLEHFTFMKFGDEVKNKKPDPEIYLAALDLLGVSADQAVALEDSPNGVLAAQRAGIFCVAVPNKITSQLSLDHADMRLTSLAELPLEKLIAEVETRKRQRAEQNVP